MKNLISTLPLIFALISCSTLQSQNPTISFKILNGEYWQSGVVNQAPNMPYDQNTDYDFQLLGNIDGNQAQPLLISNKGRYVWSEAPFEFRFNRGVLQINGGAKIDTGSAGKTLREVQYYVRQTYFPASGQLPDPELFAHPQYNTWIELNYNQNQADVLKYARAILDNGFPAGVLMIDDTWQENYGVWDFHPRRFPRPKEMIDELHQLGFKVMVWICPFVSPDSKEFRELEKQRALIEKDAASREPLLVKWWNGYSAELDFSTPDAVRWFRERLDFLQRHYGVDGFKFDAGDPEYYPASSVSKEKITANRHTELFAQIGLSYPLNEYRACWKMGGQPLAQRLRDKAHSWEDLQKLIPGMALAGLTGYTFSCPDMIGGGEIGSFWGAANNLDQDLIVRSAQCSAIMPMMQFSVAPWRVLDSVHLDAVKKPSLCAPGLPR